MDYGHDLAFGSFITPVASDPQHVVDLAVATERAGLDLATFQDHPYQPAFLDTWTLLSFVGARTRTISLSPNVANLPLRPPAVLARAASSLDLLTGGRVELGLGAGAFWEAIAAMGGRRLTPGQAVTALAEAVGIIRGVWGVGPRPGPGELYSAVGFKPAPAAHDIGIWLGAYKPRMLELTGRSADGWLPSLGRMNPAEIVEANGRIDDAALAAGRAPSAVRRLANVSGPPLAPAHVAQWTDELTGLALEHGFSTFIVGGDDPAGLELVGGEIAPAVREAVAAARGR
jgi:alkanesulfonate monooxygenase SsuD/methylene tetrahydromethanopterin reductase-like flavin-dependent oxidoreductase (luciferase family)